MHYYDMYMETNAGNVRTNNEDYIGAVKENNFYVISDGMGGHNAGEVASEIIINTIVNEFMSTRLIKKTSDIKKFFINSINKANNEVYSLSKNKQELKGMGGTFCALYLLKNHFYISWVGDSRIYLINNNDIILQTEDHSYVWQLYKNGLINYRDIEKHPLRNMITRAVGTDPEINIEFRYGEYKEGDKFLLCSDGLNSELSDIEIYNIIKSDNNIEKKVKLLIDNALEKGGNDNISVILIDTGIKK